MRVRNTALAAAFALAALAPVAAQQAATPVANQQTAVEVDDGEIVLRGCVTKETGTSPLASSSLVWSRGGIMLAGAAATSPSAPNPVGTSGLASRVFYWLDDDAKLAEHVGQEIEIAGELEDFDEGEIEIDRDGEYTNIEIDLGGEEEKLRVPTAWLGGPATSDKDEEFDIVGRRIDVEDLKVIGACSR